MSKILDNEINIITDFFKDFTDSVLKMLSEKFDSGIFDKVEFNITSVSDIRHIDALKINNVLYRLNYTFDALSGSFLVLIPEEFVAIASEAFMGGNAKNAYDGTLDELEINASLSLFNKILDEIKSNFKAIYRKEILLSLEPTVIVKNVLKGNEIFKHLDIDFSISQKLKLGNEKEFLINTVANLDLTKELLTSLGLLENNFMPNINQIMTQEIDVFPDIRRIADIKINIFAELGRIKIPIKQLLGLVSGSIIELDTYEDSHIKVFANGLEVAKAQVVVVDEHFGIKITEILSPEERYQDK